MRVAIHQPNFCPWFPFFYKMAMADLFILLDHVQFEKNGYQNRFQYKGKWITKPVYNKTENIADKNYIGLEDIEWFKRYKPGSVAGLNELWIRTFAYTLNIKTTIINDGMFQETRTSDKTGRLVELLKQNSATHYITNVNAKFKYLDEGMIRREGIEVEYCNVPRHLQRSTFEVIEEYGIEGAIKQLPKKEVLCET